MSKYSRLLLTLSVWWVVGINITVTCSSVCLSRQSKAAATCRMPFLPHDQQRQSTEGNVSSKLHTHPSNGPFSGTTQVSRYQKGKTNLDFTEARDSEWQWLQLSHVQVCTSLQTDNNASTPPLSFLQARLELDRYQHTMLTTNHVVKAKRFITAHPCCQSNEVYNHTPMLSKQ